jgi:ubiquinone/menaquinone biosynthesis C-methylase UbiE
MKNDWQSSAAAWIKSVGEHGDFGRRHVLDPAMLDRVDRRRFHRALDVGCGEGRFCRLLQSRNIAAVGIDPTPALIEAAIEQDRNGTYQIATAEKLPFDDNSFDLVISYLVLIDIADIKPAIAEMSRVLAPGGVLLVANVTSMVSAGAATGWIADADGNDTSYPVDRYFDEYAYRASWAGISVENWHRPLAHYMQMFLVAGLQLTHFDEPKSDDLTSAKGRRYQRLPWFNLMEWVQP